MGVQSGNDASRVAQSAGGNYTGVSQAAAAGMESASVNTGRNTQGGEDNTWSFLGGGLPDLVSLKGGGADVRTLQATIAAILAKDNAANTGFTVDTVSVDNTVEHGWRYSAVAVVVKQTKTNIAAFFPMLLESTESAPLETETKDIGVQSVTVLHVPSDGLDRAYVDRISRAVLEANPGVELMDAGGMVIPRHIDASSEEQVRPILANATRAGVTVIVESNPAFTDLNLGLREDNTFQNVTLHISTNDHVNIVSEPVRQDVQITLTARKKQQEQQQNAGQPRSINQGSASETVVGITRGYFDISFAPQNANAGTAYGQGYGVVDPLARSRQFVKRLVITDLYQPRLATLPSALLQLFTSMVVGEPSVSDSVFFQNMKNHRLEHGAKDKSLDPTDVGVLNLISNVRNVPAGEAVGPYDLKSNTVTQGEFASFMQSVFVPEWSVAIDVPRAGPTSWVLNVFSGAAAGNEHALQAIIQAADKLTNGIFSKHFFGTNARIVSVNSIFSEVNNTVHLGYYLKQTGEGQVKRDIRHIDYLYILNRYGQIDKTPLDWATSFLVDRMNPYQRMSRRKEIIEAAVSGKVYFTDFAERHTFSDQFLTSLLRACVEAGLKPNFQYNNPLAGAVASLAAPQFVQGGLMSAGAATSGFTTAGGATQAGGAYNNPNAGRWLN